MSSQHRISKTQVPLTLGQGPLHLGQLPLYLRQLHLHAGRLLLCSVHISYVTILTDRQLELKTQYLGLKPLKLSRGLEKMAVHS
jgi:hypothetical protein